MRIFLDSDVVISSLLSSSGAAYLLINEVQITPVISSISFRELHIMVRRMGIDQRKFESLIDDRFEIIKVAQTLNKLKLDYADYVTDINDTHIIAGARLAKVKFLISYNLKHFKTELIKNSLDILVLTPALLLQYLKSQK